ncbi:hypothetical protein ABL78_7157 [Leptomonas seymouri]|uniref:Sperm-tail PG-rich repeat n=1 Tax=Leptomonas seymouri TaxID=5684 RepID=A0A0N1PBL9_LEPSE|nr:hypothetical protein ABL78_7157 [Leptomonas seymouri]|eukprot:KPI83793.1 hypothetical protein ABL78_7157 [Leptomonas seymouri]
MIGGFTNYAHLRLRDHRPGNGDYELPPTFGPDSSSSKRSILGRNCVPQGTDSCGVGSCAYDVPSTIGTGRATRFAPPSKRDTSPSSSSPTKAVTSAPPTEPKQYSMALSPDTPSYSLYGRLRSEWEQQSSYASPGPAAYAVPGYFDQLNPAQQQHAFSGVAPGVHFGMRSNLSETREREGVPGPGTYNLVRFGDEVRRTHEPIISRRRRPHGVSGGMSDSPGPGAYDDPSSIGYRAAQIKAKRLFAPSSTFGGRWKGREYHTAGPGPAAYNTLHAAKVLEKDQRHPPKFVPTQSWRSSRSNSEFGRKKKKASDSSLNSVQPLPTLPSDFDYDYRKGKSILGKWHLPLGQPSAASMGDAGSSGPAFWESPLPRGGRFTAGPYDPNALELAAEAAKTGAARASEETRQIPGPASYQAQYNLTEQRAPAALFGHTSSSKFTNADNGVPGPGHYCTVDDASNQRFGGHGPVFYKGDFHPRGCDRRPSAGEENGGGPGAHYNDGTLYSCSINGDRASNKGYTMGIRYPARATYQYCAPYDETTNINCVYPDELTWETKVKLHLPPVHSARK